MFKVFSASAITACFFLAAFSYAMFTGNLQRGVPYDLVESAKQAAHAQQSSKDAKDMAAAFGYGK